MSHHLLGDTPNQHVGETGEPVRRRNNQIDVVIFRKSADIQYRRAFRENCLKFYAAKVHGPDELSHFALGTLPGSLLQGWNIIERSAFRGIDVSDIRGVQQNDLGPKFIRE